VSVGLIGYGRFGRLAARHIAKHATVYVHDRRKPGRGRRGRIVPASLARAAEQPVVILAVPVSELRSVLRDIRPHLSRSALVVDVCAVKVLPAQWMKAILPPHTRLIGAHPLFGPDTALDSVRDHTAVLCRVRCPAPLFRAVCKRLEKSGIAVLEMTPARHDRLAAETVFLTQLIGRAVRLADLGVWPTATRTYRELMDVVEVARHDTPGLFRDMFLYNTHARRVSAAVGRAFRTLERDMD